MSEVVGSERLRKQFRNELGDIFDAGLYVIGRVGRTALANSLRPGSLPPVRLVKPRDGGLRAPRTDIDVMPVWQAVDEERFARLPFQVDFRWGQFLQPGTKPHMLFRDQRFDLDPSVLEEDIHRLDGAPVRTFRVSTQQAIEHRKDPTTHPKYLNSQAEFDAVADTLRRTHPDQFLADALYQPIRDYANAKSAPPPPPPHVDLSQFGSRRHWPLGHGK